MILAPIDAVISIAGLVLTGGAANVAKGAAKTAIRMVSKAVTQAATKAATKTALQTALKIASKSVLKSIMKSIGRSVLQKTLQGIAIDTLKGAAKTAAQTIGNSIKGQPWAIIGRSTIAKFAGGKWQKMPGGATDVGIGPRGSVWVIGGGGIPYRWNAGANRWNQMPGRGLANISVGPGGPWSTHRARAILRYGR